MSETRSSAGGLTAALLTFGLIAGALGGSLRTGAPAPQGTGTQSASAAQGTRAEATAPAPSGRFAGMGARLLALSLGDTAATPASAAFSEAQLDVLIATVPDPVDSHEDWVYDASLEALRRAHERAGYVIDRMWLPWASRDSVLDDAQHTRLREAYPGVLLFRAADGRPSIKHPQYRLVYLVGEVATAGVHPRALLRALAERDLLVGARTPNTLAVVGPTFSGSAAGLGKTLDVWRHAAGGRSVRVITGSATNRGNRDAFPRDPGFEFRSTVNSNETLFSTLRNVILPRLHIRLGELAILTEGSAYAMDLGEGKQIPEDQRPLQLTFPTNIGSLRAEAVPAARSAATAAAEAETRVALTLSDAARPMETPPVASRLTVASIDLTLDQIAQTLRTQNVRAIVIAATDIRDRIFLMTELRQRLRDVHFFALEANTLYLAPEHQDELRGMVVVSTYSLVPETQTWGGDGDVVPFTGEYAQGVYNATLWQIGRRDLLDYFFPADKAPPHPPVWITAVGSTGMIPLRVAPSGDAYASVGPASQGPVAEPDPRADFVSVASYLALLAIAGLVTVRSVLRLRTRGTDANADGAMLDAQVAAGGSWLAELEEDAADRVFLFRRARWGSLRYQEQLYRFLAAVTVAAAAVPSGAIFAAAVLRAEHVHRAVAGMVRVTGAVALLAAVASLAGVVLTGIELFSWWSAYRPVFRARKAAARRGWRDMWRVNVHARRLVFVLGLFYLGLALAFAGESWLRAEANPVGFTLLFYRATRLDCGLSPLSPLLVCAAGFLAWTAWHQRRVKALRQMTAFEAAALSKEPEIALADVDAGDAADEPADAAHVLSAIPPRAVRGMRQVRERLFRLVPDWRGMALAAVLTVVTAYVWLGADPTLERLAGTVYFGNLYLFGLAGMLAATAWGVYRLLSVWSGLKRVLQALSGTPLVTAFERLPTRVSRLARLGFVGVPRSAVVAPISALQWRHLVAATRALKLDRPDPAPAAPAPEAAPAPTAVSIPVTVDETGRLVVPGPGTVAEATNGSVMAVAVALAPPAPAKPDKPAPSEEEAKVRGAIAAYMQDRGAPETGFGTCGDEGPHGDALLRLAGVLETFWEVEPDAKEFGHVAEKVGKGGGPSVAGQVRRSFGEPLRTWLAAAEEYAAVQVVDYVEWVVGQLRVLALFLFAALVLTTALLSTYPYEPQSLVKLIFFVILLASVGGLLRVSVEMNRDEVLSRVAKTEPGKITWDRHFLMNGLVFGIVPIATLVSSEFPAVREFLFAWIYPLTRLLGGGG